MLNITINRKGSNIQELIKVVENEPRVSHRVVAENTKRKAQNIKELIDDNKSDFEEFGIIRFETEKLKSGAGRGQTTYYLNEQQATLLMTYLRNNEVVREFKKSLVKSFFELRDAQEKNIKHITAGYKSQIAQRNTKIKLLESIIKDSEAKKNLMSKKYLMDEDCDFKQQIEHLLKQTQEELNNTPTSEWTFFQNRSNYFITYIKAMRVGGSELQRFTSELIDKALSDRNKAENKYMNLEQKYNTLKNSIDRCCNNVA